MPFAMAAAPAMFAQQMKPPVTVNKAFEQGGGTSKSSTEKPKKEAPPQPETCVVGEAGSFKAEIVVYVRWRAGGETSAETVYGPARRTKREAQKDCIELRTAASKCSDPTLSKLRKRAEDLEDITWTEVHLGGRQLDGAESHPRATEASAGKKETAKASAGKKTADGSGPTPSMVEVADVRQAIPGSDSDLETWAAKAKVALQQLFKRYGPVLDVRILQPSTDSEAEASVRFASVKAADAAVASAWKHGGFLTIGDAEIRVRQPVAEEKRKRKFPAPKQEEAQGEDEGPKKKKLRPHERFAQGGGGGDEPDESERFWEQQRETRGTPGSLPQAGAEGATPAGDTVGPPPDKPEPEELPPDASEDDKAVHRGQGDVAKEMSLLLEMAFSARKKALKSLRRKWHPDKNPDRLEVATRVFQFIQGHDQWLAYQGLE